MPDGESESDGDGASGEPQHTQSTAADSAQDQEQDDDGSGSGSSSDDGDAKPSALSSTASAIRRGGRKRPAADDDDTDNDSDGDESDGDENDKDGASNDGGDDDDDDGGHGDDDADSGEDGADEKEEDGSSSSEDESSGSGSSDDDGSSSSGESEEEDDKATTAEPEKVVTDEHGRKLSAYEVMRLERIRRNQAKLASLGLEGNSRGGGGSSSTLLSPYAEAMEKKRAEARLQRQRRKSAAAASLDEGERRSSSRKRSQVASYSELPERESSGGGGKKKVAAVSKWRTEKPREQRIPLWIYREFRRIETERKKALKTAEKDVRAANIEIKFARRTADVVLKKERKREEQELRRREYFERDQEKRELSGLFRQVDMRRNELLQARKAFDGIRQSTMQSHSKKYLEYYKAINDAMTSFPQAIAEAEASLDCLLLQRCPDDMKKAPATEGAGSKPAVVKKKAKSKRKRKGDGEGEKPKKKKKRQTKKGSKDRVKGVQKWSATAAAVGTTGATHRPVLPEQEFPINRSLDHGVSFPPRAQHFLSGPAMAGLMRNHAQVHNAQVHNAQVHNPNVVMMSPSMILQGSRSARILPGIGVPMVYQGGAQSRSSGAHTMQALPAPNVVPRQVSGSLQNSGRPSSMPHAMQALPAPKVVPGKESVSIQNSGALSGTHATPALPALKVGPRQDSGLKQNSNVSRTTIPTLPAPNDPSKDPGSVQNASAKGKSDSESARPSTAAKKKERKIKARNVGGPVSADFAASVQRSWLAGDSPVAPSSSKQFVPQAGDTVLYYPLGHKEFLRNHTDHLGQKTKSKLRVPLWERAKSERFAAHKKGKKEGKPSEAIDVANRDGQAIAAPELNRGDPPVVAFSAVESTRSEDKSQASDAQPPAPSEKPSVPKEGQKKKATMPSHWWNEHWLSSVDAAGGSYPILCRVESTHAEFPHDSEGGRKAKRKEHIVKVSTKEKAKRLKLRSKKKLRLSVTLVPLTSLIPPTWKGSASDRLHPPPKFSIAIFPSKMCQPFLVPFFWAYRQSHSMKAGDRVKLQFDDDVYSGTIQSYADNSNALGRAFELFPEIFRENAASSLEQRLERLLSLAASQKASTAVPTEDLRALLQYVYYCYQKSHNRGGAAIESRSGGDSARGLSYWTVLDFVCATLPRWDNAVIRWDDSSVCNVSPWELSPDDPTKQPPRYAGSRPGDLVSTLEGNLQEDVELSIQDYIEDTPEAASFASDEKVASEDRFVPLGMSLQRVLRRLNRQPLKHSSLQPRSDTANSASDLCCYYRSISSLQCDLSEISYNCVLYNDPDSDIAKSARKVVDGLKAIVKRLESSHDRERKAKAKETGNQMLLWNQDTASAPSKKVDEPFTVPMRRLWAQEVLPDRSWGNDIAASLLRIHHPASFQGPLASTGTRTSAAVALSSSAAATESPLIPSGDTDFAKIPAHEVPARVDGHEEKPQGVDRNAWVPQVGDRIIYNQHEHCKYLRGHFPSLTNEQRMPPSILPPWLQQGGSSSSSASANHGLNSWFLGTVVSVRSEFPPQPLDGEGEGSKSFDDLSPILSIGIKLHYAWAGNKIHFVHWRPCQVKGPDRIPDVIPDATPGGDVIPNVVAKGGSEKRTIRVSEKGTIRVKVTVKKRQINSSQTMQFKPKDYKSKPRLARALGVESSKKSKGAFRRTRVKIKLNNRVVKPSQTITLCPRDYKRNPNLVRCLFGKDGKDGAGRGIRVKIKLKNKEVYKKRSIVFSPKDYEKNNPLFRALSGNLDGKGEPSDKTAAANPGMSPSSAPAPNQANQLSSLEGVQAVADDSIIVPAKESETAPLSRALSGNLDGRGKPIAAANPGISFPSASVVNKAEILSSAQETQAVPEDSRRAQAKEGGSGEYQCRFCGLNSEVSFIRPAWVQPSAFAVVPPSDAAMARCEEPAGIPSGLRSVIGTLLDELEQRCVRGIAPDTIVKTRSSDRTTTATAPPQNDDAAAVVASLSSERRPNASDLDRNNNGSATGRGGDNKSRSAQENLSRLHFLPPWTCDSSRNRSKQITRSRILKHETLLPLPNMCLDLVKRRLRQGYYRQMTGATHDIREAYLLTVLYLLSTAGVESMKKVAYVLMQREGQDGTNISQAQTSQRSGEKKKKKSESTDLAIQKNGVSVTLKEASLIKRIEKIRKLYATAVTCFTHTTVVETVFRKKQEQQAPQIQRPTIAEFMLRQRQNVARQKLDTLLNVQYDRDDCMYRRPLFGGEPSPMVRVKVTLEDEEDVTKGMDNKSSNIKSAAEGGPAERGEGSETGGHEEQPKDEARVESAETKSSESKGGNSGAEESREVEEDASSDAESVNLSQPLLLAERDYEGDPRLVTFLFGRTNRKEACLRCKMARKSMFACRVRRAHSNPDFDPNYVVGTTGIDGLIETLLPDPYARPARTPLLPPPFPSPATTASIVNGGIPGNGEQQKGAPNSLPINESSLSQQIPSEVPQQAVPKPAPPSVSEETHAAGRDSGAAIKDRALEVLRKAELALRLANDSLASANAAMESRPVLSEEFIKTYFPVDESDGHYEICTICGTGGDVLCCETCPNVSHAHCVNLDVIPENDWLCPRCSKKRDGSSLDGKKSEANVSKGGEITHAGQSQPAPNDGSGHGASSISLASLLEELKSMRQKPKPKAVRRPVLTEQGKEDKADKDIEDKADEDIEDKANEGNDDKIDREDKNDQGKEKEGKGDEIVPKSNNAGNVKDNASKSNDDDGDGDSENASVKDNASNAQPKNASDDDNDETDDSACADGNKEEEDNGIAIGTKILKSFDGHGDFEGAVLSCPDGDQDFFRVRYIDGDEEDMSEDELQGHVAYWKATNANANDVDSDSPKRKRRKQKRLETAQAREKKSHGRKSPPTLSKNDLKMQPKDTESSAAHTPSTKPKRRKKQ